MGGFNLTIFTKAQDRFWSISFHMTVLSSQIYRHQLYLSLVNHLWTIPWHTPSAPGEICILPVIYEDQVNW